MSWPVRACAWLAAALLMLAAAQVAHADNRIALLIGNQGYVDAVGPLKTPHNDVRRLADKLDALGFKVTTLLDASRVDILAAVDNYIDTIRKGDANPVGMIYYAGHGFAIDDANFLIPLDVAKIDKRIRYSSINLAVDILDKLQRLRRVRNGIHFVIVDACRNEVNRGELRGAIGLGFSDVKVREGTLVMFSAAPGRAALDRDPQGTDHSPFARALLEHIDKPDQDALLVFRDTGSRVIDLTRNAQRPHMRTDLFTRWFFRKSAAKQREEEQKLAMLNRAAGRERSVPVSEAEKRSAIEIKLTKEHDAEAPAETGDVLTSLDRLASNEGLTDAERERLKKLAKDLRRRRTRAAPAAETNFTYYPPGDLVPGSGEGLRDFTVYAPDIAFPIANGKAYLNSQIYGWGGYKGPNGKGPQGSQNDPRNYAYPWRDNFCETRQFKVAICPAGRGHQGVDIRAGTPQEKGPPLGDDGKPIRVVAVEDGIIVQLTRSPTLVLQGESGTRWRYLQMDPDAFRVKRGQRVRKGQVLGLLSNYMAGRPNMTTYHLHIDARRPVKLPNGEVVNTYIPLYMSMVRAYERKWGPGRMIGQKE